MGLVLKLLVPRDLGRVDRCGGWLSLMLIYCNMEQLGLSCHLPVSQIISYFECRNKNRLDTYHKYICINSMKQM